jgi:hypothetical protein
MRSVSRVTCQRDVKCIHTFVWDSCKEDYMRDPGLNGEGNVKMNTQELLGGRVSTGLIWRSTGTVSGALLTRH